MSEILDRLNSLPDISFVDKDVETLLAEAISVYEQTYFEQTGIHKTLSPGDPMRILIYTQALREYAAYQKIDYTGKQNLLKYSNLDVTRNIGIRTNVEIDPGKAAITTMRFNLAAVQPSTVPIAKGTLVTTGNNVFFETAEYGEVITGNLYIDIIAKCTEIGEIGNGFVAGQINILVEPIPYISSVQNLDTSQGGTEMESNDSLKERIILKPESFSVAGPTGAYEYFTKEYNPSAIINVSVTSPSPGVSDVRFILQNGELPDSAIINGVLEYLSDSKRRPLTDQVLVNAPEQIDYDITLTYYIKTSDSNIASTIQTAVNKAISDYKLWQKIKIGRDINPDELSALIKKAGAKRSEIVAPVFRALTKIQVAKEVNITVTYGGLEDE